MEPCRHEDLIGVIRDNLKEIRLDTKKLLQDVASLKVKAGFWGALGGAIPLAVGLIAWFLRSKV